MKLCYFSARAHI